MLMLMLLYTCNYIILYYCVVNVNVIRKKNKRYTPCGVIGLVTTIACYRSNGQILLVITSNGHDLFLVKIKNLGDSFFIILTRLPIVFIASNRNWG